MPEFHLPGTWSLTARDGAHTSHPVIVFTADHSLVERVDVFPETALGVWRWDDEDDDGFQFNWIRYTTDPAGNPLVLRMRASNRFTGPHAFSGKTCIDVLDAAGGVLQPGVRTTTHDAVRMHLVPWQEDCTAPPA